MKPTTFLDTVRSTIEKHHMMKRGDRILVAVSGGPDSVALFTVLVALREEFHLNLHAAYVNHGLRPPAASRESLLVKKLGSLWNVPAALLPIHVRKKAGESLETAARRQRYEALIRQANRLRCSLVAVGHQRDDQAETVLLWLLRGAGTTGFAGIPPVRPLKGSLKIIRPLMDVSRDQIEDFLKKHGLRPLRDVTNRQVRFLRNRIRHELLPFLELYNPQIRKNLAQCAEIIRTDVDFLDALARREFRKFARVDPKKKIVHLDRLKLRKDPLSLRRGVLRCAVDSLQGDRQGWTLLHWEMLDHLLFEKSFNTVSLPHRFSASCADNGGIILQQG